MHTLGFRSTAVVIALVLGMGAMSGPSQAAPAHRQLTKRPKTQAEPVAKVTAFRSNHRRPDGDDPAAGDYVVQARFPAAGTTTFELPRQRGQWRNAAADETISVATPRWLSRATSPGAAPSSVTVNVLPQDRNEDYGLHGVLFSVNLAPTGSNQTTHSEQPDEAATGDQTQQDQSAQGDQSTEDDQVAEDQPPGEVTVPVRVDYTAFKDAIGGDWASRLQLGQVSDCEGAEQGCETFTPLPTTSNWRDHTLTAEVSVTPGKAVLLAAAAEPSGDQGDFTATPLTASSEWNVGLQTGNFSWSYPIPTVPVPGDLAPSLAIGYSSQAVDGRTPSSNNQTSWIGEGQSLETGFIERSYEPCPDGAGGHTKSDLCWKTDNATLSFRGSSSQLVHDSTTGEWRARDDEGWRIRRLTDTSPGNGDNNGEYWVLTDQDGTRYYFGKERRFTGDTNSTKSTWTVPVFGDDAGDPCHNESDGWCRQAWRWNLDYVVDVHDNTVTYNYAAEKNHYGLNGNASQPEYDRGGYLTSIDYGQIEGQENNQPAARVEFVTAERCDVTASFDCDPAKLTQANASHWPDVPFDQICDDQSSCSDVKSPTFFSRKKLTGVRTQVLDGVSYDTIDSFLLDQEFRPAGDGTGRILWLNSISRTGKDGADATVPNVTFHGDQMANRVLTSGAAPLLRWRVDQIHTETGGTIMVTYSGADCTPTDLPASPSNNQRRCFPVYWQDNQFADPSLNWMHKYLVTSVTENDMNGTVVPMTTTYTYSGGGAWHYDDNEIIKAKYRTYGDWRGYNTVVVAKGSSTETGTTRTYDKYLFMRGMDGDRLPGGGTRQASVTDSAGTTITDYQRLNGFQREHIQKNGSSGEVVLGEINDPWRSPPTADDGEDTARLLKTAAVHTRKEKVAGSGFVNSTVSTSYDDSTGLPTEVDDAGNDAVSNDSVCTRTWYSQDASKWLLTPVRRVQKVSVGCGTAVTDAVVVSDQRNSFDGHAYDTTPTRGDITEEETLSGPVGSGVWKTTAQTGYDARGRAVQTTDGEGNTSTVTYTPSGNGVAYLGAVQSMTATNPLGHATTTTYRIGRGLPTSVTDPNGEVTSASYDALGRVTAVWRPGRVKGTDTPDVKYSYQVRDDNYSSIKTETRLNDGTYKASWEIYDALLRSVETQTPALDGTSSHVLSTTKYNSVGLAYKKLGPYTVTGTITEGDYYSPSTSTVFANHAYLYDGTGRQTADIYQPKDIQADGWRTTTSYDANTVTVDPPTGATPTKDVSDVRGNLTSRTEFLGASPSATNTLTTTYAYDANNAMKSMVDPSGNTWTWTHDLRGNVITARDPDAGTSTTSYDNNDKPVVVTDARGMSLFTAYDALGRATGLYDGTSANPTKLRASWLYDKHADGTPFVAGKLTSATRYITPGQTNTALTNEVTGYDDHYRVTGTKVTVPSVSGLTDTAAGDLAGSYTTATTYNYDGSVDSKTYPVAPGLPTETIRYSYTRLGQPDGLGGRDALVADATYSPYGEPLQFTQGDVSGKLVYTTWFLDDGTRRLTRQKVSNQALSGTQIDDNYAYDEAGNVLRIADQAGGKDIQCFKYDNRAQLKQAYTIDSGACPTSPSQSVMGTTDGAYWTTYNYDDIRNRTKQTEHVKTGSNNTVRQFTYPASGAASGPNSTTGAGGPHAVTQYTKQKGSGNISTVAYAYDAAGNMTQRGSYTNTWDSEGRMVATQGGTNPAAAYVYDADGARTLRRDPDGTTTLYLDGTEIKLTAAAKTSQRWYQFSGQTVATRTSSTAMYILAGDHHGTAQLQVSAATAAYVKRRFDPFGNARGGGTVTGGSGWNGDHGFLDKPIDTAASNLAQIGDRYYDLVIGRFISVDPELDTTDSAQANAYAYAGNNPVTLSDPTGRYPINDDGTRAPTIPYYPTPSGSAGSNTSTSSSQSSYTGPQVCTAPPHLPIGPKTVTAVGVEVIGSSDGFDVRRSAGFSSIAAATEGTTRLLRQSRGSLRLNPPRGGLTSADRSLLAMSKAAGRGFAVIGAGATFLQETKSGSTMTEAVIKTGISVGMTTAGATVGGALCGAVSGGSLTVACGVVGASLGSVAADLINEHLDTQISAAAGWIDSRMEDVGDFASGAKDKLFGWL